MIKLSLIICCILTLTAFNEAAPSPDEIDIHEVSNIEEKTLEEEGKIDTNKDTLINEDDIQTHSRQKRGLLFKKVLHWFLPLYLLL